MNISETKISRQMITIACGESATNVLLDIEQKIKRKFKYGEFIQFGQIQSLLFPTQMASILIITGHQQEANLINKFFCGDYDHEYSYDCSGMLSLIPGAWDIDRIVKHMFKTKTSSGFLWVDEEQYNAGMKKMGLDIVFTDNDRKVYSEEFSKQFSGDLMVDIHTRLNEDITFC